MTNLLLGYNSILNKKFLIKEKTLPYVFLGLVFFLFCYLNYSFLFFDRRLKGDYATIALDVIRSLNFSNLSGPYSRFGFRHTAPFYSYLYSFAEYLNFLHLPKRSLYQLTTVLLNFSLLFLAVRHLVTLEKTTHAISLIFFTAFISPNIFESGFYSIWGPSTTFIPFILLITVACNFTKESLPVLALAYGIAGQNHLNSFFLSSGIFFFTILINLKEIKNKKPILTSVLILFLFYLPVILDITINTYDSNPYKVANFILTNDGNKTGSTSSLKVANFLASFFLLPFERMLALNKGVYRSIFGSFQVTLIFLFAFKFRKLTPLIFGIFCFYIIALNNPERLFRYPYTPFFAIVCYWYGYVTSFFLSSKLASKLKYIPKTIYFKPATLVILLIFVSLRIRPKNRLNTTHCPEINLNSAIRINSNTEKVLIKTSKLSDWKIAVKLLVELQDQGIPSCLSKDWNFLVTPTFTCMPKNQEPIEKLPAPFQKLSLLKISS